MRFAQRVLAPLIALALVAAAVLLVLEVLWAAFGQPPLVVPWQDAYDNAGKQTWSAVAVRAVAGALTALGVLLLLVALVPRRAARLRLVPSAPGVDAALTRRGLRTALREAATRVDGVRSARVKLGRRRAKVVATSRLGSADAARELRGDVQTAVTSRLDDIALARAPRVRVTVKARRGARKS